MKFSDFKLNEQLLEAISYQGFDTATPIQEQVIPIIQNNKDLIACAQTGTGKTGAFVIPILNKLAERQENITNTLIIVPTRELAIQIEQQIQGFAYFMDISSIAIYGGGDGIDWATQKGALTQGTDIVVATPGKLLSHLRSGDISFKGFQHLVLDEADRMLDMGFIEDIKSIVSFLPKNHQTLMFSATMSDNIRALAKKILHQPEEISLAIAKPAKGVDQKVCFIDEKNKPNLIKQLFAERKHYQSILVFTTAKSKVTQITQFLNRNGINTKGISSNLTQDQRETVLLSFRAKQIQVLVATDVMSRGIDIKEINLILNYDLPHDAETYVHRVGRTARVDFGGEAITLVTRREMHQLKQIEKLIESRIPRLKTPFGFNPDNKSGRRKKPFKAKKKFGKNRYEHKKHPQKRKNK